MYYYEAYYINTDTGEEVMRKISFDGQPFKCEVECTIYAVETAYMIMRENEMFAKLEFIAC